MGIDIVTALKLAALAVRVIAVVIDVLIFLAENAK